MSKLSQLFTRVKNRCVPSTPTTDFVDLADKPLTLPPLVAGLAIQMAQQDAERDWGAGAHDVPSILNGSANHRLEVYRQMAARLRSESRQRHTMAKLANRINRARIVTGGNAEAPQQGHGLAALKVDRHGAIAGNREADRRVAAVTERVLGAGAVLPSGFGLWTLVRLLLLGYAFSVVVAGAEIFVLQSVISFLTRTKDPREALAWAVLPVLCMVVGPKVAGARQRSLDHAEATARDTRRRFPTFVLVLTCFASASMALVRGFAAMAERAHQQQPSQGQISKSGAVAVSGWETSGLIVGFVMLGLVFLSAVLLQYLQARRSPLDDQIAYLLAVRSSAKAGKVMGASVQQVATVEERLRVNQADLEATNVAFAQEREAGVEALAKNMVGTYLVELANNSGDPRITDALIAWTDERADAMEREVRHDAGYDGDAA